jgi:phenylacetate-CoA ligase
MSSLEIIKKFMGSGFIKDRIAREIFDRLPLWARFRIYYGKAFLYWSALLKESEYFGSEKLEALQHELLKDILCSAEQNVPYYRNLFADYGFNPAKLQCLEDIKVLPYLTKEIVRDNLNDFIATNIPKKEFVTVTTSGSSGIPLTIYHTKESKEIGSAFNFHLLDRVGFTPKSKTVVFQWRDIKMGNRGGLIYLRYGNKLILSSNHNNLQNEWMIRYYEMIRRFRPEFISGYVTGMLSMAFFIKEQGFTPLAGINAVFAHSETMYPWQRRIIEESFGARAFPSYGMHEGVVYGGGCEHSNHYHMFPQKSIIEFIDGEGNHHEIVGTDLNNYAMPFIRYRTMDIGIKKDALCDLCNRRYPLLESIEGRSYDFLVNRRGKVIPGIINVDSKSFKNVKQFQFYQEEPGIVYLKIVRSKFYSDSDTLLLENEMKKEFYFPELGIEIKLMFVDDIKRSSSGKTLRTDQRLRMNDYAFHVNTILE